MKQEISNYLTLDEANQLVYALVADIAHRNNLSYVAVKGPVLAEQQLRPAKTSCDVDIIVTGTDFKVFSEKLAELGWKIMADLLDDAYQTLVSPHSRTFYHDSWPNQIDVHVKFPGVEISTKKALDLLLEEPFIKVCAHKEVLFPSKIKHAYLHLVHILRHTSSVEEEKFEYLAEHLNKYEQKQLLEFAEQVNGLAIIKKFYVHYFGDIEGFEWGQKPKQWKMITSTTSPGALHFISIMEAPLTQKPVLLFRAVFPKQSAVFNGTLQESQSPESLRKLRKDRLKRFRTSLKSTLRELIAYYGNRE
ncbi:MAG: nucleotidyltransferase family protein [Micrococcaceae bacterium]